MFGSDLIGGYGVREALAGFGVSVCAGEPERAAPVRFIGELVAQVLDDGEIFAVPFERFETIGERVIGTDLILIWEPRLFGHAPAEAEEEEAFCWSGCGLCRERFETERMEERQGDHCGSAAEKVASGESHGRRCGFQRRILATSVGREGEAGVHGLAGKGSKSDSATQPALIRSPPRNRS